MKILIIEDNHEIVEAVSLALRMHWPEVKLISTHLGDEGVQLVERETPDLVILDLGLPDINGFEALKQIRLFSSVPIIILTVRAEESDVVKGLEWGADDYVVKPFRQMELLARAKALLRRRIPPEMEPPLVWGSLNFDPSTHEVLYLGKKISLTPTEGQILHHLLKHAGQAATHTSLAEAVWGVDYPGSADSLKVHMRRLREKLEDDPSHPQLILTKPGVGYLITKPD